MSKIPCTSDTPPSLKGLRNKRDNKSHPINCSLTKFEAKEMRFLRFTLFQLCKLLPDQSSSLQKDNVHCKQWVATNQARKRNNETIKVSFKWYSQISMDIHKGSQLLRALMSTKKVNRIYNRKYRLPHESLTFILANISLNLSKSFRDALLFLTSSFLPKSYPPTFSEHLTWSKQRVKLKQTRTTSEGEGRRRR